jgi:hypothetical protein
VTCGSQSDLKPATQELQLQAVSQQNTNSQRQTAGNHDARSTADKAGLLLGVDSGKLVKENGGTGGETEVTAGLARSRMPPTRPRAKHWVHTRMS